MKLIYQLYRTRFERMQRLNLPEYQLKIRTSGNQQQIFDEIRRKYVALIPEEWVRQNFIHYLIYDRNFPKGLIAVEHPLTINGVSHRADIVVFSSNGNPLAIVECKATDISIDQNVVLQASRYNILLKAPYLMLTNGIVHFCVRIDFGKGSSMPLSSIPAYDDLKE